MEEEWAMMVGNSSRKSNLGRGGSSRESSGKKTNWNKGDLA